MAMPNPLEKLEYQKVLSYISKYCSTELGKENILSRQPFNDISWAIREGNRINQAKNCLINNNLSPLEYLPNLIGSLSQSNIEGSVLSSTTTPSGLIFISAAFAKAFSIIVLACLSVSLDIESSL